MDKISACGPGVLDLLFGLGLHACIRFWIGDWWLYPDIYAFREFELNIILLFLYALVI
jgi:hypothetical protein